MTIEEAKKVVKNKYPKAVCSSLWLNGQYWREVRSQRNGKALGVAVCVYDSGADGKAWKDAAEKLN